MCRAGRRLPSVGQADFVPTVLDTRRVSRAPEPRSLDSHHRSDGNQREHFRCVAIA